MTLSVVSISLAPVPFLFTILPYFLKIDGDVQRVMKILLVLSWWRKGEDLKMMKLLALINITEKSGEERKIALTGFEILEVTSDFTENPFSGMVSQSLIWMG